MYTHTRENQEPSGVPQPVTNMSRGTDYPTHNCRSGAWRLSAPRSPARLSAMPLISIAGTVLSSCHAPPPDLYAGHASWYSRMPRTRTRKTVSPTGNSVTKQWESRLTRKTGNHVITHYTVGSPGCPVTASCPSSTNTSVLWGHRFLTGVSRPFNCQLHEDRCRSLRLPALSVRDSAQSRSTNTGEQRWRGQTSSHSWKHLFKDTHILLSLGTGVAPARAQTCPPRASHRARLSVGHSAAQRTLQ